MWRQLCHSNKQCTVVFSLQACSPVLHTDIAHFVRLTVRVCVNRSDKNGDIKLCEVAGGISEPWYVAGSCVTVHLHASRVSFLRSDNTFMLM